MTDIGTRIRRARLKADSSQVVVRLAGLGDIEEIREVEMAAWGPASAAPPEKIASRIQIYPEGQRVGVASSSGTIVGFVSTMRLSATQASTLSSWSQVTDDGFITGHTPNGDHLYGVDMSVSPEWQCRGLGNRLLSEIAAMVIEQRMKFALLGGRLPGLREFNQRRVAEGKPAVEAGGYVLLRRPDGKALDPELRFYQGIWFLESIGLLPNYFPDPDSLDFGVLLRWRNPLFRWFCCFGALYRTPATRRLAVRSLASIVKRLL